MNGIWEVAIILILLVLNGLLSMTEIALVSARKARLRQWAEDGDKAAQLALDTANSPSDFLSAVQVGITLVGIFAGAFAGATIAHELAEPMKRIPSLAPYADGIAMGVIVSVVTYLSLIIGELVPKRLALNDPEKIARMMAPPMQVVCTILKPFVAFLSASTALVIRLLGVEEQSQPNVTEAEIHVMVEQAAEAGVFEEAEQELVASVLRLDDRKVAALMTPRVDLAWLDVDATRQEIQRTIGAYRYGTIPVGKGSLDELVGLVDIKNITMKMLAGRPVRLAELVKQPKYVPEQMTALELIDRFRESRVNEMLVMDEYGTLIGLVTRDDVFEAIVGEVPLRGESSRWQILEQSEGVWLIDGQAPIDLFTEKLDIAVPEEEHGMYQTLAGFVLTHLNRLPVEGDSFDWERLHFEVTKMDKYKIDKVLVSRLPDNHSTAA